MTTQTNLFEAEDIRELQAILADINSELRLLHYCLSTDFHLIILRLKRFSVKANEKNKIQGTATIANEIKKKALNSLNKIIVYIQFHDITRQKLENIQQINEALMEELTYIERHKKKIKDTDYVYIVPEIASLHIAQINNIFRSYQSSSNEIKTYAAQLNDLLRDNSWCPDDMFQNFRDFELVVGDIICRLEDIADRFPAIHVKEENKLQKLKKIQVHYTMQDERKIFRKMLNTWIAQNNTGPHTEDQDDNEDISYF